MSSSFQPTRASPPRTPRPCLKAAVASNSLDVSGTSSNASAALAGLSPEDVSLIDAIIRRAPSSATTFLTVFKAYNEVLHERGLDSGDDVVYYRMLLKLGVVKGKDWGEKWSTVKMQLGYDVRTPTTAKPEIERAVPVAHVRSLSTRFNITHKLPKPRHVDSFTVHSHQDTVEDMDVETETEASHAAPFVNHLRDDDDQSEASSVNAEGIHARGLPQPPMPTVAHFLPPKLTQPLYHTNSVSTAFTEKPAPSSPTPPSYRAATREAQLPHSVQTVTPRNKPRLPEKLRPHLKRSKESTINEAEAWKKIKMERDVEDAICFREDRLIERCWHVWRESIRWLRTTSEQVDMARNNLTLRNYHQRWRSRYDTRQQAYLGVAYLADARFLRRAWILWTRKVKERQLVKWRSDMRKKMSLLKAKRDRRLKEDAWAKWRQLHQSHLAGHRYSVNLCIKVLAMWRRRLGRIDQMENVADDFTAARQRSIQERYWRLWKRCLSLRETEKYASHLVGLRIQCNAVDTWKTRMRENYKADMYNDLLLLRRCMRIWKATLTRIDSLQQKAIKHRKRQEIVLIRAVMRVWIARERGKLLGRVRSVRLMQDAWTAWVRHRQQHILLEERAIAFVNRSSSSVLSVAFKRWVKSQLSHRNADNFAVRYNEDQLRYKTLTFWRIKLRSKLRMVKQARLARRYLLVRHIWDVWRDRMAQRQRERLLEAFQVKILRKAFQNWRELAAQQQYLRHAAQRVEQMLILRVMRNAMKCWTTRVIDLKLRELEVVERRDHVALVNSFQKWKSVCSRHAEDLSLMQSYQDVKREETMRRMFHRWLAASRKHRHRRITMQQREEKIKQETLATAWDKWREKLQAARLQPLENVIVYQFQKQLLFKTFGLWHSQTKSGPAIRFHTSRAKVKFWKIWRDAMPKALQAKEARKHDRQNLLARTLDKWVKTYRTKIALKAVARARYLRLPSGNAKSALPSSTISVVSRTSIRSAVSFRSARTHSPDGGEERRPAKWTERPASVDAKPEIPRPPFTRGDSRTIQSRLNAEGNAFGSRPNLWMELREVQKRSHAGTEGGRSVGSR